MLAMIWAQGKNRAIGRDGIMPWHIPEDLRFFQRMTTGRPVIMGRRTWESLGEKYRPLPGRTNIVVSRNPEFVAPGASVVRSLDEAIDLAGDDDVAAPDGGTAAPIGSATAGRREPLAWIMGGAQIYAQALPLADFALVTEVDLDVPDPDTFAPEIPAEWSAAGIGTQVVSNDVSVVDPSGSWNTSVKGTRYRFTAYTRPGFTLPDSLDLLG
ncbi:MAG: dihydrofolate reductase [Ancrocorticia sp.]